MQSPKCGVPLELEQRRNHQVEELHGRKDGGNPEWSQNLSFLQDQGFEYLNQGFEF